MGAVTGVVLWLSLAQGGSFSFEGIEGEVRTTSPRAFVATGADPSVQQFEDARGEAHLTVRDRIDAPGATYGDRAGFTAVVRVGLEELRIELVEAGAPPVGGALQSLPFPFGLEGGARTADVVFGGTAMGPPGMAAARAAVSVFGRARIVRNGLTLADRAPIQVFALATGVHADDDTHRRLPAARAEDTELVVYVPRLESGLVERGFLLVTFEDVTIQVGGRALAGVPEVPTTAAALPGAVPRVAQLEDVPQLSAPNFAGLARSPAAQDAVRPAPTPLPGAPRALNSDPATPLPSSVDVVSDAVPLSGPFVSATQAATPLPPTVAPLNAAPAAPLLPSGLPPGNAQAATPLLPGITPLNADPAAPPISTTTPPPVAGPGTPPATTPGTPAASPATTPGVPSAPGLPALTPAAPAVP